MKYVKIAISEEQEMLLQQFLEENQIQVLEIEESENILENKEIETEPQTFEEWNAEFTEQDLDKIDPFFGKTVREVRQELWEAETHGESLTQEEFESWLKTFLETHEA